MRPDDSSNSGDPYEIYVGRWSCRVAPEFLAWLDPRHFAEVCLVGRT
jgi:hypothetical protein